MSYQIKKFFVNVYLKTHFGCAWDLSRLICIDDTLDYLDVKTFRARYGKEVSRLKERIPDFVLEHFGLL